MKVVFLHPDLGIGGAERLVVDAAVALQSSGHSVEIITNHHDSSHCFQETKDGTLKVTVVGSRLPRHVLGRFSALCAYIRMIVAAYFLVYKSGLEPDLVFCDQISACIPILKWGKKRVIFYCHFPDQLLTKRSSILKKLYRWPIDKLEEITTGMADTVLVNSKYTASVFRETFKSLEKVPIQVVYPSLNFSQFDRPVDGDFSSLQLKGVSTVFLSINRFERKKNLALAIFALDKMLRTIKEQDRSKVHLIIAGGYDPRVVENADIYSELEELVTELKVKPYVTLLKSPSDQQKHMLLHSCTAVIYTPENEHFGIVPLEAMYMCRPVIATNTGGPLETIVHEETGFLCDPDAASFAQHMFRFVRDRSLARELGVNGNERVKKHFSYSTFKQSLKEIVGKFDVSERSKDK